MGVENFVFKDQREDELSISDEWVYMALTDCKV